MNTSVQQLSLAEERCCDPNKWYGWRKYFAPEFIKKHSERLKKFEASDKMSIQSALFPWSIIKEGRRAGGAAADGGSLSLTYYPQFQLLIKTRRYCTVGFRIIHIWYLYLFCIYEQIYLFGARRDIFIVSQWLEIVYIFETGTKHETWKKENSV